MSPTIQRRESASSLDQELEAIRREVAALEKDEETVRSEYVRAMAEKAKHFGVYFNLFLAAYEKIRDLNRAWRRNVFRGEEPFSLEMDAALRGLFGVWCLLSGPIREKAEYFERHGANFQDCFLRLAEHAREAKQTYRTWEPPALSSAPALRTLKVPKEDLDWARFLFPK